MKKKSCVTVQHVRNAAEEVNEDESLCKELTTASEDYPQQENLTKEKKNGDRNLYLYENDSSVECGRKKKYFKKNKQSAILQSVHFPGKSHSTTCRRKSE